MCRLADLESPRTGHVEKTNDRDYDVEERYAGFSGRDKPGLRIRTPSSGPPETDFIELGRRFRTMEAASLRLQKEARGYLDSLRGNAPGILLLKPTNGLPASTSTHMLTPARPLF